ncbi:sporulation-delaying protein SdpB family protein [Pedobacter jeongneungensis]
MARTVLALSTFLTIMLNNPELLFKNADTFNAANLKSGHYIFQKFNFFLMFGVDHLLWAKYIAAAILLLVICGFRPRLTCLFHSWICISFNYATLLIEGGDQIAGNLSLMLIPICLLDRRQWHWTTDNHPSQQSVLISGYFLLIIKLQMCIIYFHAGIGKIPINEWANGTATYYWLNDPVFGMTDWMHTFMDPILSSAFGVALLTWGTIVLEILLFMAIMMNKRAKKTLFILGITFHLGILFFHGLVSFFFSMAAGLMLYLWVDNPLGSIGILRDLNYKHKYISLKKYSIFIQKRWNIHHHINK